MSRRIADLYPRAFVTGASSGLGRAFTEKLIEDGVRVWGTARDSARLADFAARCPTKFSPVILDLADASTAEKAFALAAESAGGFDLVINNAGYGVFGGFETVEFSVWKAQLDATLVTTLCLAHRALREMRARNRGCLVNVSSLAVELPLPYMSGYNVAKAALSAFSESLIVETKGSGISVIDFRPGDFRTDFNQAMQSVSPSAPASSPTTSRAWQALENHLRAAPVPAQAAIDLRRALMKGRRGTVRSGSRFQACVAPFFTQFMPASLRRAVIARYYGL